MAFSCSFRAVPLGIALLCASNPKLPVVDLLSKLSHDADAEVACNSILALGLIGAGMAMMHHTSLSPFTHPSIAASLQAPTMHALLRSCAPWHSTTIVTQMPSFPFASHRFVCFCLLGPLQASC